MTERYKSTLGYIGNTPLIRLNHASEATGCEILGKAEFMNPGGSIKDRAALGIVRDAERKGQLRPGGIIVEGTAGNTGIGLAVVGNALGYKTVIVMPDNQSKDKIDTLKSYGVTLHLVPAVPLKNPEHFTKVSERIAEELSKSHFGATNPRESHAVVEQRLQHDLNCAHRVHEQLHAEVEAAKAYTHIEHASAESAKTHLNLARQELVH